MKRRKKRNLNINSMYNKYGEHSEGVYCGGCCNCIKDETVAGKKIYKCLAYGVTNDRTTDWHAMWKACGYFNMPFDEHKYIPVIGIIGLRPQVRKNIMDGLQRQITYADYKLSKFCTDKEKAYYEKVKSDCESKLAEFTAVKKALESEVEKNEKA